MERIKCHTRRNRGNALRRCLSNFQPSVPLPLIQTNHPSTYSNLSVRLQSAASSVGRGCVGSDTYPPMVPSPVQFPFLAGTGQSAAPATAPHLWASEIPSFSSTQARYRKIDVQCFSGTPYACGKQIRQRVRQVAKKAAGLDTTSQHYKTYGWLRHRFVYFALSRLPGPSD